MKRWFFTHKRIAGRTLSCSAKTIGDCIHKFHAKGHWFSDYVCTGSAEPEPVAPKPAPAPAEVAPKRATRKRKSTPKVISHDAYVDAAEAADLELATQHNVVGGAQ